MTLNCTVYGNGSLDVYWQNSLGDQLISDVYEFTLLNLTLISVTIVDIQAADGGIYTCTTVNEASNGSLSVLVYVEPYFTFQPENILTRNGSNVNILCTAEAFPPPTQQWEVLIERDGSSGSGEGLSGSGELLPSEMLWIVETIGEALELSPVVFGDEGFYRCMVTTDIEDMTLSTYITVAGECDICLQEVCYSIMICFYAPMEFPMHNSM